MILCPWPRPFVLHLYFWGASEPLFWRWISSLVVFVARSAHNDVVHLEHHAAQLRCQHQLLLLSDQGVDDERLLHVVAALVHAVHSQAAANLCCLDLLRLDLGQRGDGVETAVLGQCHGHGIQGLGKSAHGVLLETRRLGRSILDGQRASNLGGTSTVDDAVVPHQVSHHAESIVQRALGLVDDLCYSS